MKKKVIICTVLCALVCIVSCKKEPSTSTPHDNPFVSYEYTFDGYTRIFAGQELPYRIARIGDVQGGNSRLVIYLHGGTSRGSDNDAQLSEPAVDSIARYLANKSQPSVLLVPQCPADGNWDSPRMRDGIKALLQSYIDSGYVNPRSIFILGGSMGGTGTWNILSAFPHFFAAGMPCAGNPSRASADSIALIPVYTVMGTADNIMSIPTVDTFMMQLNSRGATYRYDVEQGWTHQQTCIESYTTTRLDWLFSHQNE